MGPGVAKVATRLDLRNLCNTRRTQGDFAKGEMTGTRGAWVPSLLAATHLCVGVIL